MRCTLDGLDCAGCAAKIERELQKNEGLRDAKINYATKTVNIPEAFFEEAMVVIKRVEPGVRLLRTEVDESKKGELAGASRQRIILLVSTVLFLIGLIFNKPLHETPYSWMEYAVLLTSYLLVGWPVILRAVQKILRRQLFDESFLMTIATIGAVAIHQLTEAAGVMLFYAIGIYFQNKAVERSRRSIQALLDIQPEYANLKIDGESRRVRPEEVGVGQMILVKPGERIPLDGEVVEGVSFVDTSALTGESVPKKVETGETVMAGSINGQGLLTVSVNQPFNESSIVRILNLVEKAGERKARTEQFITRFAHFYTPIVVSLALAIAVIPPFVLPGAVFLEWFYRALVLLVISCPCALMVSIPLGYFGGIGGASRKGILIKGANFLDALSNLDTVVFDKTGTLTHGVFWVTKVIAKNGFNQEQLLATAAAAEVYSNHPIASSIRDAFGTKVEFERVVDYQEIPAHGVKAVVDGQRVLAGNDRLMHRENIIHEDCEVEGTTVYVAVDGKYAGYIIISDELKPDAVETVQQLKMLGVERVVMLTGDEESVAHHVAQYLGLDDYYAELLPEDKVTQVEKLLLEMPNRKKGKLAFVGDGVNDAPVITRADVGVAMGGLGRDAAMEAADVVLIDDAPSKLAQAVEIARRTKRIVWQNIFLALCVKGFFIVLGALGVASIWEAVFADVGVTLVAVFNATRTLRFAERFATSG